MKKNNIILIIIYQAIGYMWHFVIYIGLIPVLIILLSQGMDYLLLEVLLKINIVIPAELTPVYNLFAVLVFAYGLLIMVEAMIVLYEEAKVFPFTVISHKQMQPGKLATRGWYGKVRHPMILGYLIALIGVGLFIKSITLIIWWVPLIGALMIEFAIASEEKKLLRWFGDEYRKYQNETPVLFPRIFKK